MVQTKFPLPESKIQNPWPMHLSQRVIKQLSETYFLGNKKEFLLSGENTVTKLQRNSAYCWFSELAAEERMVSSEPTVVKIRILAEGQQGSTLWHRVCLHGIYWDKNDTQSPSCGKWRTSSPRPVSLHDSPCRARRLRQGMLQDAWGPWVSTGHAWWGMVGGEIQK